MRNLQEKYILVLQELIELENEKNVKRYIELNQERESIILEAKEAVLTTGEKVELIDGTVSPRTRVVIKYDETRMQAEVPELYLSCFVSEFSPKKAEEYPELNEYATSSAKQETFFSKKRNEKTAGGTGDCPTQS